MNKGHCLVVIVSLFLFGTGIVLSEQHSESEYPQFDNLLRFFESTQMTKITDEDIESGLLQKNSLSWEVAKSLLLKVFANYQQLYDQMHVMRVLEKDRVVGYYIKTIEPGSIITKAGLKNGDIVTNVNEMDVDEFLTADSLNAVLFSGEEVRVTLLRNGKKRVHRYIVSD